MYPVSFRCSQLRTIYMGTSDESKNSYVPPFYIQIVDILSVGRGGNLSRPNKRAARLRSPVLTELGKGAHKR